MEQIKVFDEKFKTFIDDKVKCVYFENTQAIAKNDESKTDSKSNSPEKQKEDLTENIKLTCSYCKVEFENVGKQREHYKLDWHRYNLKQSLLAREALTEEQFNDKTDDISSISGSDSEKEDTLDTIAAAQGKIFIENGQNVVFSLYKCLLFDKKEQVPNDDSLYHHLQKCANSNKWCILMLGGGHFAGAIFEKSNPILHKTFHCYTVRAGQGGSQGNRDSKSGGSQPKSAGASLRRYNEQALVQHVRSIMETWKSEMDACNLIVYRAAGPYNRGVLFDGKPALLDRSDSRLRSIPFSTRRATFAEVKRVHDVLSSISVYANMEQAMHCFTKYVDTDSRRSKVKSASVNRAKSRELQVRPLPVENLTSSSSDEDEDLLENLDKLSIAHAELNTHDQQIFFGESLEPFGDSLTPEQRKRYKKKPPKKSKNKKLKEREEARKKQLSEIIKTGNIDELQSLHDKSLEENKPNENLVETNSETAQDKFYNEVLDETGNSLLHLAALYEQGDMVKYLLDNEANPCAKNSKQQTPYTVTQNKDVREVFKQFAKENPDKYNYNKAQIPVSILTLEEIMEKKKAQRKMKREKDKEKKKVNEAKKKEQEQQRFLKLTDREKRALAAERRLVNQSGAVISRCFLCAADITGKVPFQYLENNFCSVTCVKAHRMQNPTILS